MSRTIRDLVTAVPVVDAELPCPEADGLLRARPEVPGLIVMQGRVAGYVDREGFFAEVGGRYGWSLHQRGTIAALAGHGHVSGDLPIGLVASRLMSRPPAERYRSVLVVENGYPLGALVVADVMAALVEDERRAARALDQLAEAVRIAPVIVFALDPDGTVLVCEGQGLQRLGLQPGQLVGHRANDVFAGLPEVMQDVTRALAGEQVSALRATGDRLFHTTLAARRGPGGQVERVSVVWTDVTPQALSAAS